MSALDWAGVGGLIGLLIVGFMWWRIDIAPQIRRLRARSAGASLGEPEETK